MTKLNEIVQMYMWIIQRLLSSQTTWTSIDYTNQTAESKNAGVTQLSSY